MLMLQRSAEVVTPVECKDAAVILACALNGENCPAACKKAEVKPELPGKAGDLVVTATPATDRKVLVNGKVSDLDTITLTADQTVSLEKVVLERYGFSSASSVDEVWLENAEGVKVADGRSLNSKDEVTLNIKKEHRNLDKSGALTIVVKTTAASTAGGTLGFKVKEVVSSAKNTNLSNYKPYTYDMVDYTAAQVSVVAKGSDKTYNYTEKEAYEVARFQVKAAEAMLVVNGFTLTNSGVATKTSLDASKFLKNVEVLANGKAVNGVRHNVNKDDQLVISFDKMELAIRERVTFVVKATFEDFDAYGNVMQYKVSENGDFNATEKKTGARVTVNVTGNWPVYTFNGGKIKLSNNKLGAIDAAQGSVDVLVAEGDITLSEAVKTSFTVKTTDGFTGVDAMKLLVAGEEFDGKRVVAGTNVSFEFNNVILEKSGKVQFKADIHTDAVQSAKVDFTIDGTKAFSKKAFPQNVAKYEVSRKYVQQDDVNGSITFSQLTVQAAKASLKNNLTKKVEFLKDETTRKVVFDGTYLAKKGDVKLNAFVVSGTNTPNNITFYLSIDGNEVEEVSSVNMEERFTEVLVKAGKSVNVKVEAEVYGTAKAEYDYTLNLRGEDENGNDAGVAKEKMVKVAVVEKGSVTVADSAEKDTVLLKKSNVAIAKFVVKPSNGVADLTLDSLVLSGKVGATVITGGMIELNVDGDEKEGVNTTTGAVIYDTTEKLPVEGLVVEVVLKDEVEGKVELKLLSVNDKVQTKVFKKEFVSALVTVKSQENKGDETKYTLAVETSDADVTVSDIKLQTSENDDDEIVASKEGTFVDGDTISALNLKDAAKYIKKIQYKIGTAVQPQKILKSEYSDFFKVGTDNLKVFKVRD